MEEINGNKQLIKENEQINKRINKQTIQKSEKRKETVHAKRGRIINQRDKQQIKRSYEG